jgi:hypothetical protein
MAVDAKSEDSNPSSPQMRSTLPDLWMMEPDLGPVGVLVAGIYDRGKSLTCGASLDSDDAIGGRHGHLPPPPPSFLGENPNPHNATPLGAVVVLSLPFLLVT